MTVVLLSLMLAAGAGPMGLAECIQEALRRHPEVLLSRQDVARARAERRGSRSGYLPRVDVTIQDGYSFWGAQEHIYGSGGDPIKYTQPGGEDGTHSFGVRLVQNILDGGKWWTRIERADREIHRARLGVEATREDVALQVIVAYYSLVESRRELAVLRQALQASREHLRLARERKKLGAASRVDVAKARVSVGEDRMQVEYQLRAVAKAGVDLNLAMGRPADAQLTVEEIQPTRAGAPDTGAGEQLEDHARLRAIEAAREVALLDTSIARADHWPHVTGLVSYSRTDPELYKVYSRFDQLYRLTFMLSISFPIFEGFATSSRIEQAEVAAERVRLEHDRTTLELQGSLARARSDLHHLAEVVSVEEDNIRAAEQQLELADESFRIGQGTALELRDAQLAVTRARIAAVKTRFEIMIALATYHHARGDLLATYLPGEQT